MKKNLLLIFGVLSLSGSFLLSACRKEPEVGDNVPPAVIPGEEDHQDTSAVNPKPFAPTPYPFILPLGWPPMKMPAGNPLTVEGVALGRKLFYEPMLSKDNTMSCGSCHNQAFAFSDNGKRFSDGLQGQKGTRNSMPIFNLGWVQNFTADNHRFFWDGGASDLESQVVGPIQNPLEMDETLTNVVAKIRAKKAYGPMFRKAFGSDSVTIKRIMQAIAQFERTIISSGSKMDQYLITRNVDVFTPQEYRGLQVFNTEGKADCFHCHNIDGAFSSDFQFHHNGHTSSDEGLKRITGRAEDVGKFRTPTLRNLVFTAPYMHDGRFNTLEEVVEFYNSGAIRTFPADEFITKHGPVGGLNLTAQEKEDLIAFLKTMTDSSFLRKPEYSNPNPGAGDFPSLHKPGTPVY